MSVDCSEFYSLSGKRVWVAGHQGMVGSALVRRLNQERCEILTADREKLDLRRQADVEAWLASNRPDAIFVASATVGGIHANATRPAEFIYDNTAIATNVIHGAYLTNVKKLMFLGAACIYPRLAPQPMSEDCLLEGPPEPTNEFYSIAKIAGVKLCQAYRKQYGSDFVSVVPANLYGPGDRFDAVSGHVIPGLMQRAEKARNDEEPELSVWGSGKALREFMHVDDCADALVFLMQHYSDGQLINVGTGIETSIEELAQAMCRIIGYRGRLVFDTSKPDGMPRKGLDSSRMLKMGWKPRIPLEQGLTDTYRWFSEHRSAEPNSI